MVLHYLDRRDPNDLSSDFHTHVGDIKCLRDQDLHQSITSLCHHNRCYWFGMDRTIHPSQVPTVLRKMGEDRCRVGTDREAEVNYLA